MITAIYFIVEQDGRARQVVNGVVTSLNKKTIIPPPIGTSEISILWERSLTRWATIRNFSLPLGFVLDGGKILRNDYYKFNIDRQLYLLIKRLVCEVTDTTYSLYYKKLYKGELDFSTFDDSKGDSRVDMNIMEGGLQKLIKAQENTKFFIPFDEDAIDVKMDGILLDGTYNWVLAADQSLGIFYAGMYQLPSEKAAPGVAIFDVTQETTTFLDTDNATSVSYFGAITQDITGATFEGVFKYIQEGPDGGPLADPNVEFTASLQIYNTESDTARLTIDLTPDDPYQSTQDISFSETFNLLKGDRLYLKKIGRFRESTAKLTLQSRPSTRIAKHFKPLDLFKKLCAKLGITEDKVVSTMLENSTYCLTSGDGLRGLEGAGIWTSFNDFCKAYDVYHFAGVQIKDTVEMEERYDYFIPDSTDAAIELGTGRDFKVSPAVDLMYSSIKIGHQEQNISDLNGKYDFNGFHIYTTPIKRVSRELDLQSPYKSGPYEETITQQNLEGKITTDNSNDNDVFVNDIDLSGDTNIMTVMSFVATGNYIIAENGINFQVGSVFTVTGTANNNGSFTVTQIATIIFAQIIVVAETVIDETNANVVISFTDGFIYNLDRSVVPDSGVPSPETIFNVRLRPSALFEKHYRWIRSWLYGYDNGEMVFDHANRNADLVVDGLRDGRNVDINDMGERIFIPDYLEFLNKVPIDLCDVLEDTPNKCFAVDQDGVRYTGFLFKAGLAPNSRQPQTFKLLSSIENNRLNLI